jgi:hypothetical protein
VAVFPDLHARHYVGWDSGVAHPVMVFHYCKNRLRMILKNASTWNLPLMLAGYLAYSLADLVLRNNRASKVRAMAWNLSHLRETLALRRAVQEKRSVSDADVFARGARRWFPPTPLGGRRRRVVSAAAPPDQPVQKTRPAVDDRV